MVNISVIVKNGRFDKALRAFKDAMWRTKIVDRYIESREFTKPSVKRRRRKLRGEHRQKIRTQIENNC